MPKIRVVLTGLIFFNIFNGSLSLLRVNNNHPDMFLADFIKIHPMDHVELTLSCCVHTKHHWWYYGILQQLLHNTSIWQNVN